MSLHQLLEEAEQTYDSLLKNYTQMVHEIETHSGLEYQGKFETDELLLDTYNHPEEREDRELRETVEKVAENWIQLVPQVQDVNRELDGETEEQRAKELWRDYRMIDQELKNMNILGEEIGVSPLTYREKETGYTPPEPNRSPKVRKAGN